MCAMRRRLLFTLVLCLSFTTISSIQCYAGTDTECMLGPDTNDCGPGEKCQCTKYRFQCAQNDTACNEYEQSNNVKKWAYTTVSESTCQYLKTIPSVYEDITCCSQNECNSPDNGKCSMSQHRRRPLHKIHHLRKV